MSPFFQTSEEVLKRTEQKRLQTLESVDQEVKSFHQVREEQVKLSQEERSKLNFLAFAIVGAVLSLSPELLGNAIVVIGLAVLLANAFIFGYFAECIQRNLNTKNAETAIAETKDAVKPYFDAYDAMLHCYDEHYSAEESVFRREFQGAFDNLQEKYIAYLEWQKDREPRYAKRTKFAIGYWYFALFAFGLLIIGTGLVLKYNSSMQMWITGLFIK